MLKKEGSPYWKFRTMQISLGWQEMCQISKKPAYVTYTWASKQTKNNLGRKSFAASASGKLVKRTLGCHSYFDIKKLLLLSAEILFIYQRDPSLQTWINIEVTADLIAYRLCVCSSPLAFTENFWTFSLFSVLLEKKSSLQSLLILLGHLWRSFSNMVVPSQLGLSHKEKGAETFRLKI